MAMKPNYRHERSQRARAKDEKKQEKLKRKQEAAEQRKVERDGPSDSDPSDGSPGVDDQVEDGTGAPPAETEGVDRQE